MSRPACSDARFWLKVNGHSLGALTGQDSRALSAIAHCWDLYAAGDAAGEQGALHAVVSLLRTMQPKCWPLARELIARSMDWDDRARVWRLVELTLDAWTIRDDDEPEPYGDCEVCHQAIDGQGLCNPLCHRTIEQLPPVTR
jgi:hypothetical protein